MTKKLSFILLILWSPILWGFSPLSIIKSINNGEFPTKGTINCTGSVMAKECPAPVKDFLDNTGDSWSSWVFNGGDYPINDCVPPDWKPPEQEKLQSFYSKNLSTGQPEHQPFINRCIFENPIQSKQLKNKEASKSLITAKFNYFDHRLNEGATQTLNALQEIDMIFGRKKKLSDVSCDSRIGPKIENDCKFLKKCPRQKGQLNNYVDLTLETLKQKRKLNKELKRVKRLARKRGLNPSEKKRRAEMVSAIEGTIFEIENAVPWINGKHFKKKIGNLEDSVEKLETLSGQRKDTLESVLKEDIQFAMIRQLKANKKELLRRYDRYTEAAECLKGQADCDRFNETMEQTPPWTPVTGREPAAFDVPAFRVFDKIQCMENINKNVDTRIGYAKIAGEIGLGVATWYMGGALRLGATALRIYKQGSRIRGAMALATLGGMGQVAMSNFSNLRKECKKASRQLIGLDKASTKRACFEKTNPQNISDYTNCMIQAALMVGTVAPALVGKSLKVLKPKKFTEIVGNLRGSLHVPKGQLKKFDELAQNLSEKEMAAIKPFLEKIKLGKLDMTEFNHALRHADTLGKKARKEFIDNFGKAFEPPPANMSNIKGFFFNSKGAPKSVKKFHYSKMKHQKRMADFEKAAYKKLKKRHTPREARRLAKKQAAKKADYIRDIRSSCMSKKMNSSHKRTGKMFSAFTVGMGMGSTAWGYTSANYNKPKDEAWYGKLTYELAMSFLLSKMAAKITMNPKSNFGGKYMQGLALGTSISGINSGIYSQIFGVDEEDAKDQLNRIKNDPKQKRALEKLNHYIEDQGLVNKIENRIISSWKGLLKSSEKFAEFGRSKMVIGGEEFENGITKEDLNDPKKKNMLIAATIREMYDKDRGYLDTGDRGWDRWLYDTGWNASFAVPKAIMTAGLMYQSLCFAGAYPKAGYSAAVGFKALDSVLSADWYYSGRQTLINQ